MSIALWTIKLSPGLVFTVKAAPARTPPACIGRSRAAVADMRDMTSLTLETGSDLKCCTIVALTFLRRRRIRKPVVMVVTLG